MATTYLSLDQLRTRLRRRLDDRSTQQYLDAELDQAINTAYRETVVLSKCHKTSVTPNQVAGTHTYDVSPIFEVIQVSYNATPIEKTTLTDLAVYAADWGSQSNATPQKWMTISSSSIRVTPPPDVSTDLIVAYGYAFPTALTVDANEITTIPLGYGGTAVEDRAEAITRTWRPTMERNLELATWRMNKWEVTLELIRASRQSDR